MKVLETELGFPLLMHHPKKVELTEAGKAFLPYARKFVELEEACRGSLEQITRRIEQTLKIATVSFMNTAYGTYELMEKFQNRYPGIRVEMSEFHEMPDKSILQQNGIELVMAQEFKNEDEPHEYEKETLMEDVLVALVPKNHPLAGREKIHLSELREDTFIMFPEKSMMYEACAEACRQAGFEPKVALTIHGSVNLAGFVEEGLGVALVGKQVVDYLEMGELSAIPLVETIRNRIVLLYFKNQERSQAAEYFIDFVATERMEREDEKDES
jgi:LysR family transcriptional activator of glutamate synthase operon